MADWTTTGLGELVEIRTGKLDSNCAVPAGSYPFFTCAESPLRINTYAFDCEAVLLAGNNANGVFHLNRYRGRFNAYQRTYVITVKEGGLLDTGFLFYCLRTLTRRLGQYSQGTATKFLTMKILQDLPLPLPALAEQRAIASVLAALDDKIDMSRRMNQTLEALARTIFKSWFVDFEPVRAKAGGQRPVGMDGETAALFPSRFVESEIGQTPEGWQVQSLDEIARFRNGLALQNFRPDPGAASLPVIKIAQLRSGFANGEERARTDIDPECVVEDGDVLFSWSGSLLVDMWSGGRGALNQHVFRVTSRTTPKWFYFQCLLEELPNFQRIAAAKATTMGHIQRHHLVEAKRALPPGYVLERLNSNLEPLLTKQLQNKLESRTLAELRDLLLPKLIAGQLRVPTAEKIVEAAL